VDPAKAAFERGRRLLKASDYTYVFADARRSADPFFTVLARPGQARLARLGLTIAKRVAKRAVDRNRLKRLARESFRHLDLTAMDIIVMARPAAMQSNRQHLRQSLDRHFRRLAGDHPGG
jgi:ribonuclease P protein component